METKWYFNNGELQGKSHLSRNIPCQDHTQCAEKDGVRVIALSDGCSSSGLSEYGARVTTEAVCNLFINRFDEISTMDQPMVRKLVIDSIGEALEGYIASDEARFEKYIEDNESKFKEYTQRHTKEEFLLDTLNATVLFAAGKGDLFFIGAVGDGTVGAVKNKKLSIVLEEKKDDAVNGTTYPSTIYYRAKSDPSWYNVKAFQMRRASDPNNSAFILICDGCEGLIDKRIPFERKFTSGVDKILRATVETKGDIEQAREILENQYLKKLLDCSIWGDDCSVAVLVREDYLIDEILVTRDERPVVCDDPEHSGLEDLDRCGAEGDSLPICGDESRLSDLENEKILAEITARKKEVDDMFTIDREADLNSFSSCMVEASFSLSQQLDFIIFYKEILDTIKQGEKYTCRADYNESCVSLIYREENFLHCEYVQSSGTVEISENYKYIENEIKNGRLSSDFVLLKQ